MRGGSRVSVQITALVSSRIYIPLSHQVERFFGLERVRECVGSTGEMRRERERRRQTWPLRCVVCLVSVGILLSADVVDSLGIFNKALIPTVLEPLGRFI